VLRGKMCAVEREGRYCAAPKLSRIRLRVKITHSLPRGNYDKDAERCVEYVIGARNRRESKYSTKSKLFCGRRRGTGESERKWRDVLGGTGVLENIPRSQTR
jgi:SET domain-containing protein